MRRLVVSGDTVERLAAAEAWLDALPRDAEVLILAPTWHAGDEIVRRAAARQGTRLGLVRATPDRLAARLAEAELARAGRAPSSSLALTAVVARIVYELQSESGAGLSYFGPVASWPGFSHAVARTLDELSMNDVGPEALASLPRGGPDLARIARALDDELARAGLADRSRVYAAALEVATGERPPSPIGMPLLVFDVAVGSAREAALIATLAERAPEAMATAPAGDGEGIARLESALGCRREVVLPRGERTSLAALKQHLFEDTTPELRKLDETLHLASWPGETRECVEIARTIQAEAARGARFDRMAVLLRSPAEYRPHLEEAFQRAGIPAFFARGTTRPEPAGRAFLTLLACAAEGLTARRFAEYLSLAQVPDPGAPRSPGLIVADHDLLPTHADSAATPPREEAPDDVAPLPLDPGLEPIVAGSLRAPWRWERVIVDASVIGGRDRWARRLAGLEEELRLQRKDLVEDDARIAMVDRDLRDLAHLRDFALPIVERLAALPARAPWGEWLDRLRELATAALRAPDQVLATLAELAPMAPVGPVGLEEVQHVLAPRLRDLALPPERRRYGAVFVATADAARGLSFDVVFVPGLAEKLFPRKIVEDPILLDHDRESLGRGRLVTQAQRVAAERLTLRLAVAAAEQRVYLSFPRLDVEQGRPRVPSFYGLEALRAAEGQLPGFDELQSRAESSRPARLGWPAPENPAEAVDEAEYDLSVLGRLKRDRDEDRGAARYLLSVNPHLARSLRARAYRWHKTWTGADGLVNPDALALEALARHQLAARSFSPTALENFSACPYKFFLQAIHRLEPREEPVALEVMDPLTRGSLYHEVQFEVFTRLRDAGLLPVAKAGLAVAHDAVDQATAEVAARFRERLAPAIPRVWEDGVAAIRADLREWLRRAVEEDDGWVPYRFELAFGLADRHRPSADPASVADPVAILGKLRLRGSIDLVERHGSRAALRVTDHKTGKARAPKDVVVGGGKHLQPVLYALTVEQLLAEPVESGRLYYCTADGGFEERVVPLNEWSRTQAGEVIDVVGGALAEGFLPAAPNEGACRWCDYRRVCGPHEETRVRRKNQERLEPLKRLRGLP
jgi:RecB family exonuclease